MRRIARYFRWATAMPYTCMVRVGRCAVAVRQSDQYAIEQVMRFRRQHAKSCLRQGCQLLSLLRSGLQYPSKANLTSLPTPRILRCFLKLSGLRFCLLQASKLRIQACLRAVLLITFQHGLPCREQLGGRTNSGSYSFHTATTCTLDRSLDCSPYSLHITRQIAW